MTRKIISAGCLLIVLTSLSLLSYAQEPAAEVTAMPPTAVDAGKTKSQVCAACHGEDGNSVQGIWPKLAGQHATYLIEQMQHFKAGEKGGRNNMSMTAQMSNLSIQDMRQIAAYYEKQTVVLGAADKKLLEKGEKLYRGGDLERHVTACIACHGPQGRGNAEAVFPALSGQHPEYIVQQLQDYRDGKRTTGPDDMMRSIASRMTIEEMRAVANYVTVLH